MDSVKLSFEAIGTHWVLDCYEKSEYLSEKEIEKKVMSLIEEFDKTYSRFRKDSTIYEISHREGTYRFPERDKELFELYEKFDLITNSSFSLLIGDVLDKAGYDDNYSLKPGKIDKPPKASEIYKYNFPNLTVNKPFILDFGGLGKGYLIDLIAKLFEENRIISYCIDGGGDIFYRNSDRPLSVGLEHPSNFEQVIGIAKINNQSICASSGNRRAWDRFHHIIDANTLKSPDKILATWVIANKAMLADGLATCLFFTEPDPEIFLQNYSSNSTISI
jgi:FAD:protein FMN transferase